MKIRVALGSLGWCRELLAPWALLCLVGVGAGVTSVRLRAVPQMPYEDFTWSIAILMAIISTAIPSALLVDRVEVLTLTASRNMWPLSLVGFLGASGLALWPAVLGLIGAPAQLVIPLCTQNAGLLGLAGMLSTRRTRLALVPTVATAALAVLPGFLPVAVHPLVPTQHPPAVQATQPVVWVLGGIAYVTAHALGRQRIRGGPAPSDGPTLTHVEWKRDRVV